MPLSSRGAQRTRGVFLWKADRRRIVVPEHHLREVGDHAVRVRLYGDEEATLKVTIEKA